MDVHENLYPEPLPDTWTEIARFDTMGAGEVTAVYDKYPDAQFASERHGGIVAYHYVPTLCECGKPGVFGVRPDPRSDEFHAACMKHVGKMILNHGGMLGGHTFRRAEVTWNVPALKQPGYSEEGSDSGLTTHVCPS